MGRPPKAKTKPDAPGSAAKPATPKAGHNSGRTLTDAENQKLFLKHKETFQIRLAAKKAEDKRFRDACKLIVADGFTNAQIKAACELDTPEGEARVKADIAAMMLAAKYMNSPLGSQFELFMEPDRTPSVDRAYDAGKFASANNQPRKPPHDPSVPQYASWMTGYDDNQRELAGGFKAPGAREADQQAADADEAGEGQTAH